MTRSPIAMVGTSAHPVASSGKIRHQIREKVEGCSTTFVATHSSVHGPVQNSASLQHDVRLPSLSGRSLTDRAKTGRPSAANVSGRHGRDSGTDQIDERLG